MEYELDLPDDLFAVIENRAKEARLDLNDFVVQLLRDGLAFENEP